MSMDSESPQTFHEKNIKLKQKHSDSNADQNDSIDEPKQNILITLIESEPAIFNPKHEDYRSNSAKDVLWSNISKRIGWSERYCKRKWKALRDQYCRELKRVRSNSKAVIKWKYFKNLDFLRPYALHRDYRLKLASRPHSTKEPLNPEPKDKESNNKLIVAVKSENWNNYSQTSQGSEFMDAASQIIEQMTHSENIGIIDEDPPDDDDDDPIHTFLKIESYFEKQLITMVESEDVLYNHQNPLYRNPKLKMSIWDEIARKLKRTSQQCRLKWKSLRDQYIREYKRITTSNNSNSGNFMPRWKYYDSLRFLENFIRLKNLDGSGDKSELNVSIEHLDQEPMNSPSAEAQYLMGDDDTTQTFADCGHSKESAEIDEESTSYTLQNETHIHASAEELSEGRLPTHDEDEIGSFFKAVAIKIRKANMSTMAFTELQIDILKVITNALRNP